MGENMKRIIYSICIGTLALAVTAWGEQVKVDAKANAKAKGSSRSAAVQTRSYGHANTNVGRVNTRQNFSARVNQPTYRANRNAMVRQHTTTNLNSNARVLARERNFRSNNEVRARNYVATNRDRNVTTFNRNRNFSANNGSNAAINGGRNFGVNRQGRAGITNNWSGQQFSGQNYAAFRNYSRSYHDRGWYRSNYPRISFYFGAPYYWDSGYWYPAWGYYPGYTYGYDGPIYGYNGLAPDQVVVDVQERLQREGYYTGPIDGELGPMTRQAITAYQSDHGLAVTSTIDQPTLATLGLS
jgi:Putative peptidoglycan binding domain